MKSPRFAQMSEDGWLNLSVLPQIKTTIRMPHGHLHCRLALLQILYKHVRFLAYIQCSTALYVCQTEKQDSLVILQRKAPSTAKHMQ